MADETLPAGVGADPAGRPHINLSGKLRAFYARRGMWAADRPCGALAQWLGERCPWTAPLGSVAHWTTHEGLVAMAADAIAAPPQAWATGHQRAQFLRRLKEAGIRAGGARAATQADMPAPEQPTRAGVPFAPLRIPPAGTRAHAAFVEHVGRTLRELVEHSQSSEWIDAEGRA